MLDSITKLLEEAVTPIITAASSGENGKYIINIGRDLKRLDIKVSYMIQEIQADFGIYVPLNGKGVGNINRTLLLGVKRNSKRQEEISTIASMISSYVGTTSFVSRSIKLNLVFDKTKNGTNVDITAYGRIDYSNNEVHISRVRDQDKLHTEIKVALLKLTLGN